MWENLKLFILDNKITVIFVVIILLLVTGGAFAFQSFKQSTQAQTSIEEVDLAFDPEGPYALLTPRKDGNALILNLKRTASYTAISYELAYISKPDENLATDISEDGETAPIEGIERGVMGTIDTKDKKGEYEQEILFGTCSKNVCKYDQGVENGTLTLHIKKDNASYRMITQWHIQNPQIALGVLTSGDGHFTYKIDEKDPQLATVNNAIVNDLTGVPKLPDGKEVFGKVYTINVPFTTKLPAGMVSIALAIDPPADAKISRYDEGENKWVELDTKSEAGKLTANADGSGIFAVLVAKK